MFRVPHSLAITVLAAAAGVCAAGQGAPAPLDAGHSYASLWMGRNTEVSVMVNVGVAQVGGAVVLGIETPAHSSLAFTLVPGGPGAQLLTSTGTLRSDVIVPIMRYTAMTFHSASARIRHDGRMEFTGELAVTHVTREEIPPTWNSANNTPSYTDPQTSRAARTVTFVLAAPRAESLASYLSTHRELVISASIDAREFPELPGIVLDSDWPMVAQDEHCAPVKPWINVLDFSGWDCTGKAISITPAYQPIQTMGRDYSGLRRYSAPVNGPVTILLHLRLAQGVAADSHAPRR